MKKYKCLNKQNYKTGNYQIIPIRDEDRYLIMEWRNEQIYHLRQIDPLTTFKQDQYFRNVINKLFDHDEPYQILFSFLDGDKCIAYGGLVHINWKDKNGEISFVMKTILEKERFVILWNTFLHLIKQVAFKELNFHKIYTYSFDLRPKLYKALKLSGFLLEGRLKDHCIVNFKWCDVLYHSCINPIHNLQI